MIKHKVATNFLRHVYSSSVPDLANITVAEGEDKYDVIISYLETLRGYMDKWISELKREANERPTP